jgi:predicted dehydrogenase
MKFLIAGFGSIGRRHFRNLLTLGEKDIVLLRSNKSTLETDELAGFLVETNLEAALAHKPDAVVLANPTALHLDVAIPAAKAGCSLFFEKPVAESLERIPQLKAALQSGGGKAFTGFQFRFHPGLQKIKRLLENKAIGEVISGHAHWGEYLPGWHPWEDHRQSYSARKDLGGGVVLTLSHPLDYLRWLLGDVQELWSLYRSVPSLEIETEAAAQIGLRFQSGAIANIHLNYIQRPPRHTLEIVGDQGTITWDNADGSVRLFTAERDNWQQFDLPQRFERNDLFLAEMRNFIGFINGREPAICTLEDGIQAQKIVEAVHQSNQEKRIIHFA